MICTKILDLKSVLEESEIFYRYEGYLEYKHNFPLSRKRFTLVSSLERGNSDVWLPDLTFFTIIQSK